MVFSRPRIIFFTSLHARSIFSAPGLKDALPVSFDVFGRFGHNATYIITSCILQGRSSSSRRCVDAFASPFDAPGYTLSTGSWTWQQVEGTGKWQFFDCTSHGPGEKNQRLCTRTYVHGIQHASACRQKQSPVDHFQSAQTMQTGRQGPAFSQPWPQQRQQGNQLKPAQSQRAQHGPMQPLPTVPTGTQFVPLAPHQSKAVPHKPPSVGLHNINNTCYMNSFVQGLFSTDAFSVAYLHLQPKAEEQPLQDGQGRLWIWKESGGASQKAIRKNGAHKAPTHRSWGYLAGISRKLQIRRAPRCHRDYSLRLWQAGRKWPRTFKGGFWRSSPWDDTMQRVWKCENSGGKLYRHCGTSAYGQGSQRDWPCANNTRTLGREAQIWGVGCWMLGDLWKLQKENTSLQVEWNCISSSTPLFVLEPLWFWHGEEQFH